MKANEYLGLAIRRIEDGDKTGGPVARNHYLRSIAHSLAGLLQLGISVTQEQSIGSPDVRAFRTRETKLE